MFEPIKALFASSCSIKGINAVAKEIICKGEVVINLIDSFFFREKE
jgi:hypothetical protein